MREKTIEQNLVQEVKAKGGVAPKVGWAGFYGGTDSPIPSPEVE